MPFDDLDNIVKNSIESFTASEERDGLLAQIAAQRAWLEFLSSDQTFKSNRRYRMPAVDRQAVHRSSVRRQQCVEAVLDDQIQHCQQSQTELDSCNDQLEKLCTELDARLTADDLQQQEQSKRMAATAATTAGSETPDQRVSAYRAYLKGFESRLVDFLGDRAFPDPDDELKKKYAKSMRNKISNSAQLAHQEFVGLVPLLERGIKKVLTARDTENVWTEIADTFPPYVDKAVRFGLLVLHPERPHLCRINDALGSDFAF